jgi:hypothetical protein
VGVGGVLPWPPPVKNCIPAAEVTTIVLAVSVFAAVGWVAVAVGGLTALFRKPLARNMTAKGGVDLEVRRRDMEYSLQRTGLGLIFVGGIIVTTSL